METSNLEAALNELGAALILTHDLSNPYALKSECTQEELKAREIYSLIHWAIKRLSRED